MSGSDIDVSRDPFEPVSEVATRPGTLSVAVRAGRCRCDPGAALVHRYGSSSDPATQFAARLAYVVTSTARRSAGSKYGSFA